MLRTVFFPDSFTMFFWGVVVLMMAVATALHILHNKREEPVSSVLWLFIVFTFPLAGIIFYLLFGVNKVYTIGERVKDAAEKLRRKRREQIHSALKRHIEVQRRYASPRISGRDYPRYCKMLDRLLPESLPLARNSVELLIDGTKAYPRMLDEISKARNSVHLQSFIIMDDAVGREIFDLLEEKSRQGVRVKVIYDRFGSLKAGHRLFKFGGGNFQTKPFSILNLSRPFAIQLRNHRKLMVIDGDRAFVGGINISSDNDDKFSAKDRYIHDLHCLIRGPAVGEFQYAFLNDWHYVSGKDIASFISDDLFPLIEPQGESTLRVVASGPGQCDNGTERIFTTAAAAAESSIWMMTPYFVPDIPFWKMLCAASARGVDIRLIVPRRNNHWYVQYATENLYPTLLDAGIRIFLKNGPFSHAKAMLVDGSWAVMGSSNCDVRSFKLNYELDFIASGGDFISVLHSQFAAEMKDSTELDISDTINRGFAREMLCRASSLLTPVL